ncbi:hypothetical protein HDU98_000288 [Podochytrium sp. JEL0797]|nr:hypothetical protein HDU98_000288 [Podochytrium sp. JEL0797]
MTDNQMVHSLLRQIPLFQSVLHANIHLANQEEIFFEELAKDIHLRTFMPGDVIIQEGEPAKCVFFIFRGSVEVVSADGELVLSALDAGSYFGEIAVLFETTRVATVRCLAKCLLGVLTSTDLRVHLEKYPIMNELVMAEAKERYAKVKSALERNGKTFPRDALHERKISMIDIGRSMSMESPTTARRRSSLMSNNTAVPDMEAFAALAQKIVESENIDVTEDEDEDDDEEMEDAAATPPEIPLIQVNPGCYLGQPPRKLAKHASEGSEVDQNNNIAGIGLDVPANSYVASLALLHTSKRRASVAVWSDEALMKLAQNLPTSPKSTASGRFHSSGLSNPKQSSMISSPVSLHSQMSLDPDLMSTDPEEEEKGFRAFPPFPNTITVRILHYLSSATLLRLRRLSHPFTNLLEDPHYAPLQSLDLSPRHKKISDTNLQPILALVGHTVRSLNLRNCWQLTDTGILSIAEHAPFLQHINLASVWEITDTAVASLARLTSGLVSLDLSNCRKLTDASVLAVLEFSPALRNLQLSYCKNLTDACMDHSGWKSIHTLNLQRCTSISDAGFEKWVEQGDMYSLRELILSDCSFLTDATVANLAKCCPAIEVASLSFCCALTEESVTALVEGCRGVRVLDVSFCGSAVTDAVLVKVAEGWAGLEKLSVRGCVLITGDGVQQLNGLRKLKAVNVTQCRNVKLTVAEMEGFGWRVLKGGDSVLDGFGKEREMEGEGGKLRHARALTT